MPHNAFGEVDPRPTTACWRRPTPANRPTTTPSSSAPAPTQADQPAVRPGLRYGGHRQPSPWSAAAGDLQAEMAAEITESYWMALLRDTTSSTTAPRRRGRGGRRPEPFRRRLQGPQDRSGKVTAQHPVPRQRPSASSHGPYLSQFMYLNTPFGVEYVERKMRTLPPAPTTCRASTTGWRSRTATWWSRATSRSSASGAISSTAATSPSGCTTTSSSRPTSTPA